MTLRRIGWCNPPQHHPNYCTCHEHSTPQWQKWTEGQEESPLERWRQHNAQRRKRTPNTLKSLQPEVRQ